MSKAGNIIANNASVDGSIEIEIVWGRLRKRAEDDDR